MCFACTIGGLSVQVSMLLNISYTPDPAIDFPIIEKMMMAVEQKSTSCQSLQAIHDRVDEYIDSDYGERVKYTAGMAQAMVHYYRPEGCTIQE